MNTKVLPLALVVCFGCIRQFSWQQEK